MTVGTVLLRLVCFWMALAILGALLVGAVL